MNINFRISWPHAVLGALGFGISAYALRLHHLIEAGRDTGCGFSNTLSCDKVIGSQYGQFAGIPLGIYGMVFFAIVLLTSVDTHLAPQKAARQRLLIAGVGVLTSLVLEWISVAKIGALCPVCLATHTTTLLLFGASLWELRRLKRQASGTLDSHESGLTAKA